MADVQIGDRITIPDEADSRRGQPGTVLSIDRKLGLGLDFQCGWDGLKSTMPSIEMWSWDDLGLIPPERKIAVEERFAHVKPGQVWRDRHGKKKRDLVVQNVYPRGHVFAGYSCATFCNLHTGYRSTIALRRLRLDGKAGYVLVSDPL